MNKTDCAAFINLYFLFYRLIILQRSTFYQEVWYQHWQSLLGLLSSLCDMYRWAWFIKFLFEVVWSVISRTYTTPVVPVSVPVHVSVPVAVPASGWVYKSVVTYELPEPVCWILGNSWSLWVIEVDIMYTKFFTVSLLPFEVIHERPCCVSLHIAAIFPYCCLKEIQLNHESTNIDAPFHRQIH